MAVSNKVFVSPGVYTSERDLSFVAQSVGVTTLGLVGETLTGPAFEPIFITNYDDFESYFGGTIPEKFVNTQIPKYELAYIAKSYLQQSNQLFVTRVLGLSGYDAGPSWSITTIANVDGSTVGLNVPTGTTYTVNFTGTTGGTSITYSTALPSVIQTGNTYTQYNGGVSTISAQLYNQIQTIINNSGTTSGASAYIFGTVATSDYDSLLSGYTAQTNVYNVSGLSVYDADFTSPNDDTWYYANFDITTGDTYTGYSFYNVVSSITSAGSGVYTGTITGKTYTYSGTAYEGWNDVVVATLRSRGISLFTTDLHGPQYQITGTTDVILDNSGSYSGISQNPFAQFAISGYTDNAETPASFSFVTSMNSNDANYITKVFGISNFGKNRVETPLFVEEQFQTMLTYGYNKGYIRGINSSLISLPGLRNPVTTNTIANYLEQYKSPESPWVVSQLYGSTVERLFKFYSIADGNSANTQIKISIQNISFNNLSFDVAVRDFFDTDANPVILEKYTNCTMDPTTNNYIAVKIGTSDGEYALNSKYIMLEMDVDANPESLPCGFEGYVIRNYGSATPPFPVYKVAYNFPGEVIYNPPFGVVTNPPFSYTGFDNKAVSGGDRVRSTYLGISSQIGYDPLFFEYKGKQKPLDLCVESDAPSWNYVTKGFHMDSGATVVSIVTGPTSGSPAFDCGVASFQRDPETSANPYYQIQARKFSFLLQGGFDGWDIYNESRTNTDRFILGGSGYQAGACPTTRYPNATGWGAFKPIAISNFTDFANTDYYAYLLGINTFSNPEAVNINVFATPGIDYVNNSNLVEDSISMVTFDRADSIYICTTPDTAMFAPVTNPADFIYPTEAVDNLDNTGIDSNYTATYYPWILVRDTVNNTQIYIPPTNEVCRNLALTDNISFPWFATAGYTRGLVNAVKARKKLTQEDRDTLYQGRINPIATFSDVGTVIWGNKTLQIADTALNRINVRRLLLQARKLISAVAVRLLFEQNDAKVRQDFLDSVNPILDAIRRDRGLYDFRVTVSNSPEDLDRNTMTGKIYLKPTKALEFIDIEFLITPTGASFENI
jgi:hypothetical protein